jgi:hypothetical protein
MELSNKQLLLVVGALGNSTPEDIEEHINTMVSENSPTTNVMKELLVENPTLDETTELYENIRTKLENELENNI